MTLQLEPSMDIGLRHVLETGLSYVGPKPVRNADNKILDSLVEIFAEAGRGSAVVQPPALLVGVGERPAFERFALFFKYLKDAFGDELPRRLSETESILNGLRNNEAIDPAGRQRAADLIQKLLVAMRREAALSPLDAPKSIVYE
jgi:hypothetical protein